MILGHLRKEPDEMISSSETFKREAVRISAMGRLERRRLVANMGAGCVNFCSRPRD
jgi:hypothetical protein